MIGQTIDDKYLIKDLLGKGGMGSVFEAEHATTGRRCAVKVINSVEMTKDPQVISRFQREARAAGAIDTQYITQVLDAGVDRNTGLPFLAMEYMEGEDLQHLLKRVGPIASDLALRVTAQSCLGLHKAHDQGVVHRDIKPHNLFLAKRDAGEVVVKLLDFGIAKVKMEQANKSDGMDLTKTGNLLGSPLYVSPEQARGKRQIDHRTDVYSLGAVLYQMLAGRTPYHHATALGDLILMVCTEPAPPVQQFAPWVEPEIAEIVHRCLLKDPAQRFQTANELFEAVRSTLPHGWGIHEDMLVSLDESQRDQQAPKMVEFGPPSTAASLSTSASVSADSASVAAATAADQATTTGPLVQPQPQPAQAEKSKLPLAAAAVVLLAAVGGGAYMLGPGSTPKPAPPQPTQAAAPPTAAPTTTAKTTATAAVKPKRVHVVIIPDDAKVAVEGKEVKIKGGILEINGIPGSVFRVTVTKNGETTADVVVTEAGALPPKIEVKAGKKITLTRPKPGQVGGAANSGATSTPTTPRPATTLKDIKTGVDEFK